MHPPEQGCFAGSELLPGSPAAAAESELKKHQLLWLVSLSKGKPERSAWQGLHLQQDWDPNQASTAVPHTNPYHSPSGLVKEGDE